MTPTTLETKQRQGLPFSRKAEFASFSNLFYRHYLNNLSALVPLIILFALFPNPNRQIFELASTSVNLLTCQRGQVRLDVDLLEQHSCGKVNREVTPSFLR